MRKELLVYIPTAEKGEEIAITALTQNRNFVLLSTAFGKVTANRKDLIYALKEIEEFDSINNAETTEVAAPLLFSIPEEIEYGEE